MGKWWLRKIATIALATTIVASVAAPSAGAEAVPNDRAGHWAERQLDAWTQKGWLEGYSDGTVRPDNPISRAEFLAFMDRAFGFREEANIHFQDVSANDWYHDIIARTVKAAIVEGYEDGTIRPDRQVSRQEAAVMLARVLQLSSSAAATSNSFADASLIASWSIDKIAALTVKNIVTGYPDSTFRPDSPITRAEAVVMIERAIAARTVTYAESGVYGPSDSTTTLAGDVVLDAPGITLQNTVVEGNLLLSAKIGDGDIYLKNVTVRGKTIVNGGGEHSVHMENCVFVTIIVDKKDGSVRIVAEGTTTASEVNVRSEAKIEASNSSGTSFETIKLSEQLPPGAQVTLVGTFANVDVAAKEIKVTIPSGSVGKFQVSADASDSSITLGADSKIVELVVNAVIKALGEGKVEKAVVSGKGRDSALEVKTDVVQGTDGAPLATPAPTSTPTPSPSPSPGASGTSSGVNPPVTGGGSGPSGGNGTDTGNGNPSGTNHVPYGSVPEQAFTFGPETSWPIHLAGLFSDADGDSITYGNPTSTFADVATAQIIGSDLIITKAGAGVTTISFTYTDSKSTPVQASFTVNIHPTIHSAVSLNTRTIEIKLEQAVAHLDKSLFTFHDANSQPITIQSASFAPYDTTRQTVLLKISQDTTIGQLYSVRSGSSSFSVAGGIVDTTSPTVRTTIARSYHEVVLTFNEPVQLDANASFQISGNGTLAVSVVKYEAPHILVLETAAQNANTLYNISVSGVRDFAGNALDSARSMLIFAGIGQTQNSIQSVAKAISAEAIYVELLVPYNTSKLNNAVIDVVYGGSSQTAFAATMRTATTADAIAYGYTADQASVALKKGIIVDLHGAPLSGMVFNIIISNLVGANGDLLRTTATFIGSATTIQPKLLSVIALDKQTLSLRFDRSIDDPTISGKIFNTSNGKIKDDAFQVAVGDGSFTPITDLSFGGAYAYKNPSDNSSLLIVIGNKALGAGNYKPQASGNYVAQINNSDTLIPFSGTDSVRDIGIFSASAISTNMIQVVFTEPVFVHNSSFAKIGLPDESYSVSNIGLVGAMATDSTMKTWTFGTTVPLINNQTYKLFVKPDISNSDVSDRSGYIGLSNGLFSNPRTFYGPIQDSQTLNNVSVVSKDRRTLVVTYPEPMAPSAALLSNYTVSTTSDGQNPASMQPVLSVEYDAVYYRSTIHLSGDLSLGPGYYYLAISSAISNSSQTKHIPDGLAVPFAANTAAPAKPEISFAALDADLQGMTIRMGQPVAIASSSSQIAMNTDTTLNNHEFPSGGLINSVPFNASDFIMLFTVTGQYESASSSGLLVVRVAERDPDGKTFRIRFNNPLKKGTIVSITTQNSDNNLFMFGKSYEPADKTINAPKYMLAIPTQ